MPPVEVEMDAGDVLIVGAGAAGVLTAVEAARAGYEVSLIDTTGVAAQQSGHHHGLVHRGSLYVGNDPRLVASLREGRAGWSEHLSAEHATASSTIIPVWDAAREFQARRWWDHHGIEHELVEPPEWLRGKPAVFRTPEQSFDFTNVFKKLLGEHLQGRTARMTATRICSSRGRVTGVEVVTPDGRGCRLTARCYVLAAGIGLAPLLEASDVPLQRLTVRTSYMLVLEAPALEPVTMMLVEADHGGLFTGARMVDGEVRWLVGDHLSVALEAHQPRLEHEYVHAIVARLRELTTILDRQGVRVGVYSASKAELRDDPNDLSPFSVDPYGFCNALVTTPTKITLAPAMARATLSAIGRLDRSSRGSGDRFEGEALAVCPELWRSIDTHALEEVERWFPN